jgi:DNA repair ATPase RecN
MNSSRLQLLPALALLLAPLAAFAQSATEAKLRDALRAATGQLRSLEDEQAKASAREAELKAELERLKGQLQAAPKPEKVQGAKGEVVALRRQLALKSAELETAGHSLATCKGEVENEAMVSRAREEARKKAVEDLASAFSRATQCEERRGRVYALAKEALQKLSEAGLCEPLLGFKRVARENLAQEYLDKLREQMAPAPPALKAGP